MLTKCFASPTTVPEKDKRLSETNLGLAKHQFESKTARNQGHRKWHFMQTSQPQIPVQRRATADKIAAETHNTPERAMPCAESPVNYTWGDPDWIAADGDTVMLAAAMGITLCEWVEDAEGVTAVETWPLLVAFLQLD